MAAVTTNLLSPDVTPQMPIAQENMFGPVVSIIKVSGEEEAVRIVNDTEYWLSRSVQPQLNGGRTHNNAR
jgi:gamma-glutamyl-gamma-aminobutyraldehyde dehydrogenase